MKQIRAEHEWDSKRLLTKRFLGEVIWEKSLSYRLPVSQCTGTDKRSFILSFPCELLVIFAVRVKMLTNKWLGEMHF